MVQQVRETLSADRDAKFGHVREIGLAEPAWHMLLREEHFPRRSFGGSPLLEPPLQCSQLPVGELARAFALQCFKDSLGLQSRTRLDLLTHRVPNVSERVLPCSPRSIR